VRWLGLLACFAAICLIGFVSWTVSVKSERVSLPYVVGAGLGEWTAVCIGGAAYPSDLPEAIACSLPSSRSAEAQMTTLTYLMADGTCTIQNISGPFLLSQGSYETRCYPAATVAGDTLVMSDGAVRFEGY